MDPGVERRASSVDTGATYDAQRIAFTALVLGLDASSLEQQVTATPEWAVRDAFAHVVGITADLNAGNFGNRERPDEWTAAQIQSRRGVALDEIAGEWEHEAPVFEEGLRLLGYEIGSHYVGDLHAHFQDVRATLGLPRADDEMTVLVALDFYLESTDEALREEAVGAVEIRAGDERHVLGQGPIVATLTAPPFEVLRVLSGRRSWAQIRALAWTGDVDAIGPRLSRYPLPAHDLTD